jgi:ABC-type amino acid transport substrate-binding protein
MKVLPNALAIFTILMPSSSLAQSIPQRIQEIGILKVGIRQDSPLFGSGENTNEQDIRQVYQPQQIINNYSTRPTGIQEAIAGNIQGFARDGILLIGTTMDLNLPPDSYNLITPIQNNRPFCAAYSMILPSGQDHQAWRDQVNAVIAENGKGTEIWNQWFLPFVPYMRTVLQGCPIN